MSLSDYVFYLTEILICIGILVFWYRMRKRKHIDTKKTNIEIIHQTTNQSIMCNKLNRILCYIALFNLSVITYIHEHNYIIMVLRPIPLFKNTFEFIDVMAQIM